ncbi:hypothetical protein FPCIR_1260 [Fusarium pseudocircinatum]|uniref:Uncharacterized protein n=1 Tax=Fusarium pseudocircinatum TaxID=56676 RepID=A0A8H5PVA0_9HYPO|nr:hypothetical protein FPCIR_1260 [Fusarium pseudocircinatum]
MDAPIPTSYLHDPKENPRIAAQILDKVSPEDSKKSDGAFLFDCERYSSHIVASQNGFIWAVADVFDRQSGLRIRVDNIWLAVLAQLKPHIYEVFPTRVLNELPCFLGHELIDSVSTVKCLSDMLRARFGDLVTNILLPRFSTTTRYDTGAAALILLGTNCQVQHYRRFGQPVAVTNHGPIRVIGSKEDWETLRRNFAELKDRSRDLEFAILRLSTMLDNLLRSGKQYNFPWPYVTADAANPLPWWKFWGNVLGTNLDGQIVPDWLDIFFDPRKLERVAFYLDMPSAVTTIPIRIDSGQGYIDCTLIGGLLAHSRDVSGHDPVTLRGCEQQPLSGWLFYRNKNLNGGNGRR